MKCPECGASMAESIGTHPYIGAELPNLVLVGVKIRTCPECGHSSVAIKKLAELHRVLARSIAKAAHKLDPGEICFLRKHLGWSGRDFARHFGVSAETVSRWENGKKAMGPTAERLLRLFALTYDPVDEYPLPDQFDTRPRHLEINASLRRKWSVAFA
jgi:putative transcriptional regulator